MGGGWCPRRNASRPTVAAAMANTSTAASTANNQTTAARYPSGAGAPRPAIRPAGDRRSRTRGDGAMIVACADRAPARRSSGGRATSRSSSDACGRRRTGGAAERCVARRRRGRRGQVPPRGRGRRPRPGGTAPACWSASASTWRRAGLPYAPLVDMLRTLDRELTARGGGRHPRAAAGVPRPARRARPGVARWRPAPAAWSSGDRTGGQARLFELLLTVVERLVAAGPAGPGVRGPALGRPLDARPGRRSSPAPPAPCRCCTIGTYRSEDVPPRHPLRSLTAELTRAGRRHLELRPARARRGRRAAGRPARRAADARGDRQRRRAVRRQPAVRRGAGRRAGRRPRRADAARTSATPSSAGSSACPTGAAAVLRACAVGGREVEHDLLADVVTRRAPPGGGPRPAAVTRARSTGTCAPASSPACWSPTSERATYRFRHALVHEAVLADVLPGELHRLHRGLRHARSTERQQRAAQGRGDQGWARLAHHWAARRRLRRRPRRRGAGGAGGRGRVRRARGPPLPRVERAPVGPGRRPRGGRRLRPRRAAGGRPPTPPAGAGRSCGR